MRQLAPRSSLQDDARRRSAFAVSAPAPATPARRRDRRGAGGALGDGVRRAGRALTCGGTVRTPSSRARLRAVRHVEAPQQPHDAVLGWDERLGRYADVSVHRRAQQTPGVVVYRLDDRLFFANARYVKGRVREAIRGAAWEVNWLVFDAEAVTHVDATGLEALTDLVHELGDSGIGMAVARLKSPTRLHFDEAGLTELVGAHRFYPTVREAVEACS
jgi:MFS superfamily sulfate permease-like transporter